MIKYNNNKIGILLYSNDSASQVMCVLRLVTARCSFVLYTIIAQFPVFLVKRLWFILPQNQRFGRNGDPKRTFLCVLDQRFESAILAK